jgi:DNA-binding NarL/FixJ family response regulator
MIKIIIADDHPIVREGLKRIIDECSDMECVGEAANSEDVINRCREKKTDVLLLDVSMPGAGFLDTLQRIITKYPTLRVLVLSIHPEEQYAIRAIRAGAAGYLTKNHTPEQLAEAIRQVHAGHKYITPNVAQELINTLDTNQESELHKSLSNREYQILCMLGGGKQLTEIASLLSLSPKTVGTYRNRILDKLKLRTTGELIRYAVEHALKE